MVRRTWILKHLRQAKSWFCFGTLLLILETLSQITAVTLQKFMIDDVFVNGDYDRFWTIFLWIALAAFCFIVIVIFSPYVVNKGTARHLSSIGNEFMQYLHRIPMERWRKKRTAEIAHYFSNDVTTAANLIGEQISIFVWYLVTVITLMAVIGWGSLTMLAVVFLFSVLYIMTGRFLGKRMRKLSRELQEKKSDLLVHIEEAISSTRETIAYHRMKWEKSIYDRLFKAYFECTMRMRKINNRQLLLGDTFRWGATLLVLGYGGYLVVRGKMSIGMLVVIFQLTVLLMNKMNEFYENATYIYRNMASVDRLLGFYACDLQSHADTVLIRHRTIHEFRFEHVDYEYDTGTKAVYNLNFALPIGKKVAFIGPSGAGKSTITMLTAGLIQPVRGVIRLNGHNLAHIREEDRIGRIGIVFQEPYLFPNTIHANLCIGNEQLSRQQIINVCKGVCIHDDIMSLPQAYESIIGERGITLSGGQRQRIAIARALLRNPDILILDEATSALDMETERKVLTFFDRMRKGKTTIYITHRLSTVQNVDYIFVVNEGVIVEQGTHHTLMQEGLVYKQLVESL